MRGDAERQANIMLAVTPDSFIPDDHPIRRIKPIVDAALQQLSPLLTGNAICGKEGAGGASEDKRSRGAGAPDSPDRVLESEMGSGAGSSQRGKE